MLETVLISISCAISLLAGALSVVALKAADPIQLRKLAAFVSTTEADLQNKIRDLKDVDLARVEAHAEALLERAELKFESAENKRKSVAARQQHMGGPDNGRDGNPAWLEKGISESERRDALGRYFRGR
jgi:hypothetical protein